MQPYVLSALIYDKASFSGMSQTSDLSLSQLSVIHFKTPSGSHETPLGQRLGITLTQSLKKGVAETSNRDLSKKKKLIFFPSYPCCRFISRVPEQVLSTISYSLGLPYPCIDTYFLSPLLFIGTIRFFSFFQAQKYYQNKCKIQWTRDRFGCMPIQLHFQDEIKLDLGQREKKSKQK